MRESRGAAQAGTVRRHVYCNSKEYTIILVRKEKERLSSLQLHLG